MDGRCRSRNRFRGGFRGGKNKGRRGDHLSIWYHYEKLVGDERLELPTSSV